MFTTVHLPEVSSTNDYAKELIETRSPVFVSALHQTAGRGRKGRSWEGGYGQNAYCSIGVSHPEPLSLEDAASYMGRGALIILHALREKAPSQTFRLKYPNDVQAKTGRGWAKIAGTLVEHEYVGGDCVRSVIGMGVNVLQQEFPETIAQLCTSLFLLGNRTELVGFIDCLLQHAERVMQLPWKSVHDEWTSELNLKGRRITHLDDGMVYEVIGVRDDGRIQAKEVDTQTERILSDGDTIRYDDRDQQR